MDQHFNRVVVKTHTQFSSQITSENQFGKWMLGERDWEKEPKKK